MSGSRSKRLDRGKKKKGCVLANHITDDNRHTNMLVIRMRRPDRSEK